MSETEDRKVREVVLAQYAYRHEAEFAAGFLDDAGVPYRLQIDDPAMGLTIATPATLWVREIDLAGARELLDIPVEPARREAPATRRAGTGVTNGARLGGRERGLALAASVGVAASVPFVWSEGSIEVAWTLAVAGLGLLGIAVAGRAPEGLRRLLRALSGSAP